MKWIIFPQTILRRCLLPPKKKSFPKKIKKWKIEIFWFHFCFTLILLFRPPSSDLAFLHPAWYPVDPASSPGRVEFKGYPWIEIITLRNLMSIWSTSYDSSTAVSILCILYITYNFESMSSWLWIKRRQLIAIPMIPSDISLTSNALQHTLTGRYLGDG